MTRFVCIAVLGVCTAATAAQQKDPKPEIPAVVSSEPMTRNADLAFSAALIATSGPDALLRHAIPHAMQGRNTPGRLLRAAKLALLDVPVVVYFAGLNHELGHVTRAHEKAFGSELKLVGTPWSSEMFRLTALDDGIFDDIGSQVGGMEASRRMNDVAGQHVRRAPFVAPGHALTSIVTALDVPIYALRNLPAKRFGPIPGTDDVAIEGDAAWFVVLVAGRRGRDSSSGIETIRRQVRRRTALNLLDTELWTLTFGLVHDYAWDGAAKVPVRWLRIGPVRIMPGVRYELTPLGPEYYLRSHYKTTQYGGTAYVRWTERTADERQAGAGGSIEISRLRTFVPRLGLDVWSGAREGAGVHGSAGADLKSWPAPRARLHVAAGAKSSGYLIGYPVARGAYVSAGLTIALW